MQYGSKEIMDVKASQGNASDTTLSTAREESRGRGSALCLTDEELHTGCPEKSLHLETDNRRLEHQLAIKKGELAQMLLQLRGEREQRSKLEEALQYREIELKRLSGELTETGTALKVLLERTRTDETEISERVKLQVKYGIIPYLNKLKEKEGDKVSGEYISLIESKLHEIIAPISGNSLPRFIRDLTPVEMQIADLVKEGKTTKEIALFLNLSDKTVEFHRNIIRRKLGLNSRKTNLKKHLAALDNGHA